MQKQSIFRVIKNFGIKKDQKAVKTTKEFESWLRSFLEEDKELLDELAVR